MQISVHNSARSFSIIFWAEDGYEWEPKYPFSTIDAALAECHCQIDDSLQAVGAHIIDAETGEIYVTCTADEVGACDVPDDVDETFYDPYMGCDVYDCGGDF